MIVGTFRGVRRVYARFCAPSCCRVAGVRPLRRAAAWARARARGRAWPWSRIDWWPRVARNRDADTGPAAPSRTESIHDAMGRLSSRGRGLVDAVGSGAREGWRWLGERRDAPPAESRGADERARAEGGPEPARAPEASPSRAPDASPARAPGAEPAGASRDEPRSPASESTGASSREPVGEPTEAARGGVGAPVDDATREGARAPRLPSLGQLGATAWRRGVELARHAPTLPSLSPRRALVNARARAHEAIEDRVARSLARAFDFAGLSLRVKRARER